MCHFVIFPIRITTEDKVTSAVIGMKAHDERVHDHRVRSTNKPVHMKRQACRDFTDLDLYSTVLFGVVSAFTRSRVTRHAVLSAECIHVPQNDGHLISTCTLMTYCNPGLA